MHVLFCLGMVDCDMTLHIYKMQFQQMSLLYVTDDIHVVSSVTSFRDVRVP